MGQRLLVWILLSSSILTPLGGKAHRKTEEGNRHYVDAEYEEALAAYTDAQVADPEAAELHYNVGNVLYRQGDFGGAADAFTRALLSGSTDLAPLAAYNLGNARFQQQEYQPAIEAYRRALTARPDDRDAKRNLELALRALEQQQEQQQQDQEEQSEGESSQEQSDSGSQGEEGQDESDPTPGDESADPEGGSSSGSQSGDDSNPAPAPGEMTAAQAERLLDSLAELEQKNLQMEALEKRSDGSTSKEKDW